MNLHHTLARRALTGLASAVVALGALAGPSLTAAADAAGSPHQGTTHVAARAAEPKKGTCYKMTFKESEGRTNTADVVPCSAKHTARAFKVAKAPAGVNLSDDAAFFRFASKKCDPAFAKVVGSSEANRVLTTYSLTVFEPSKKAIRQGDRRVECDLVLRKGKDGLAPLPTDATPALTGKAPYGDTVRKCAVDQGGRLYYTVCNARHGFRSTTDFKLSGRYPTRQQFLRADARHCKGAGAINPSREQWNAGYHYSICFLKTTK